MYRDSTADRELGWYLGHGEPLLLGRVVVVPAVRALRAREEHRLVVGAGDGQLHLEYPRRRVPSAARLALPVLQEQ